MLGLKSLLSKRTPLHVPTIRCCTYQGLVYCDIVSQKTQLSYLWKNCWYTLSIHQYEVFILTFHFVNECSIEPKI